MNVSGYNCETDIDDCGPINPCGNGANCTDQINGYVSKELIVQAMYLY